MNHLLRRALSAAACSARKAARLGRLFFDGFFFF